MVFFNLKSFLKFSFLLVWIPNPILILISFHFPSWTYPPILLFLCPTILYSFKTKKNLRFISSLPTVTLPSQALPEIRLGIAHAITEIWKGYINHIKYICGVIKHLRLILNLSLFNWIYLCANYTPQYTTFPVLSIFGAVAGDFGAIYSHIFFPINFWRRCRGEQRFLV